MGLVQKIGISLLSIGMGAIAFAGDWTTQFTPAERDAAPELGAAVSSIEYFFLAISGFVAMGLYILAGYHYRKGHVTYGFLSLIGATIVASAAVISIQALS